MSTSENPAEAAGGGTADPPTATSTGTSGVRRAARAVTDAFRSLSPGRGGDNAAGAARQLVTDWPAAIAALEVGFPAFIEFLNESVNKVVTVEAIVEKIGDKNKNVVLRIGTDQMTLPPDDPNHGIVGLRRSRDGIRDRLAAAYHRQERDRSAWLGSPHCWGDALRIAGGEGELRRALFAAYQLPSPENPALASGVAGTFEAERRHLAEQMDANLSLFRWWWLHVAEGEHPTVPEPLASRLRLDLVQACRLRLRTAKRPLADFEAAVRGGTDPWQAAAAQLPQ